MTDEERAQRRQHRAERRARRHARRCGGHRSRSYSSGNSAFDAYREETLKRLEEEQDEFHAFLDRLRQAKDKEEFDAFMAERKRPTPPPALQAEA